MNTFHGLTSGQMLAAASHVRAYLAGAYASFRRWNTEFLAPSRLPRR